MDPYLIIDSRAWCVLCFALGDELCSFGSECHGPGVSEVARMFLFAVNTRPTLPHFVHGRYT